MDELDMSRPGAELFPDAAVATKYNSYQDVNVGPSVGDPLEMGVKAEVAPQISDKEFNFRALREEVSKMQAEREYWKGQAEAYSNAPAQEQSAKPDPYETLDWDDGRDVRKAFDSIRQQNEAMKHELKDAITAIGAKAQHQDWNAMVTQHVPQLTSKNPIFAEMIKNSSNPYEAAYLLAELNAKTQAASQQHGDAQRAIANAQKPQTINSIGGTGTLSSADYYASMSDEDFMKIAGRNLANI